MFRPLIQGRSISYWNMPANPADGIRSGCYELENVLGLSDEVFYILEWSTTFLIAEAWVDTDEGSFLRIPAKTIKGFKNKTGMRTGVLNYYNPDGFEKNIPSMLNQFEENVKM